MHWWKTTIVYLSNNKGIRFAFFKTSTTYSIFTEGGLIRSFLHIGQRDGVVNLDRFLNIKPHSAHSDGNICILYREETDFRM